ncbi:hypothetical protein NECAME_17352 [Necator americanus]|uniref:PNT domain-containing protein n=1 Tax=Necator americanus TaxID=51031 RepID=W2TRH7_NECAM|nr:hypothetical protein NECAME_17352 [Necator americanus]ETN83736.1 hypothetical protein NECAME_17352 [Necator americanus]
MCQQFSLTPPRHTYLSGRALLSMSQKDFIALAPEGGDTLYAQLQLWKTAFESYHQQQSGGQSSGGITAADNSMPKNNWMPAGQTMISGEPIKNNAGFTQQYQTTELHQQHYFGNGALGGGADNHAFFGNVGDDECIDLQSMLQMQQDGMRFCGQMNGMK